jgi:hypothetical protein
MFLRQRALPRGKTTARASLPVRFFLNRLVIRET